MDVLIVDDFPAIVESIKNGVKWELLGIEKIYTACSAKEAKLLLTNFPIDIMLCDIEMPEETGLELAAWAKKKLPFLEIVFLTAHAEFDYIMEAMHLGSADYILQPVEFATVEKVLEKVRKRIEESKRVRRLEELSLNTEKQSERMLELMVAREEQNAEAEADKICQDYMELCRYQYGRCSYYQMFADVVRWKRITYIKRQKEVKKTLEDTLNSLLEEYACRVVVIQVKEECYWILIVTQQGVISRQNWAQKILEFYEFVERNMDFSLVLYPVSEETENAFIQNYRDLKGELARNTERTTGIFAMKKKSSVKRTYHPAIREALNYIDANISTNLTRQEVAKKISMSEEYFSRLFHQETGDTFKDYILMLRMEEAKKLLSDTRFSIGIIASKVGYNNFSHFSQAFRTYVGQSPQEFRKNKES